MSIPVEHPECDVRHWLREHSGVASEYTAQRISQSYPRIQQILAQSQGVSYSAAFDIGCGAGFDSFAMGVHFDHVLALDTNREAIEEAARIAREAGVTNIRFDLANVEHYDPSRLFSFVFCNIMSHNVDSRCVLGVRIAMSLEMGGWLNYAEAQEGYAPLEIHRAIQRQDQAALSERLWQVLRGFTEMRGFRFFASGTMSPLLEALGLKQVSCRSDNWNGIPFLERISSVLEGSPSETQPDGTDPDYLEIPDGFQKIRKRFAERISIRPAGGFTAKQREEIEEEATGTMSRYGPFLTLLLMADLVLPSLGGLHSEQSSEVPEPDWNTIEELDRRFIAQVRKRAGLQEGPIDD